MKDAGKTVKCWSIEKDQIDDSDIAWITGCCNRLQIRDDMLDRLKFHAANGIFNVAGHRTILVETVNEEQESMLKLKYEGALTLMSVMHYGDGEAESGTFWL